MSCAKRLLRSSLKEVKVMDDKRCSELEDDLQNFWAFVKLEARRLSLLEREIVKIKKTLSEILANDRQRSDSEEKDN